MRLRARSVYPAAFCATFAVAQVALATEVPRVNVGRRYPAEIRTYVDEVTGLKVTALTSSPWSDSKPYQTHTTWTSDGQWIIFRSRRGDQGSQAFVVNAKTGAIIQLTDGPGNSLGSLNLSRKSMRLYYMRGGRGRERPGQPAAPVKPRQLIEQDVGALIADSLSGQVRAAADYERLVATLPDDVRDSGGFTLDADETKAYWGVRPLRDRGSAAGAAESGKKAAGGNAPIPSRQELLRRNTDPHESRESRRERFAAAGRGRGSILSIDLITGEIKTVIDVGFRLGHVQANPWTPAEIVYCHETGGDAEQRMWTVRADGTNNRPLYAETPGEWITHETFSAPDEVMFVVIGHLPDLRERPSGIAVVDLRTKQVKLLGQLDEEMGQGRLGGFWHCNGSPDGRWAVGDTFRGDIYVIDRRNGKRTLLTTDHKMRPDHAHPIFSPDSRQVLIQSGHLSDGDSLDLLVVDLPEQ